VTASAAGTQNRGRTRRSGGSSAASRDRAAIAFARPSRRVGEASGAGEDGALAPPGPTDAPVVVPMRTGSGSASASSRRANALGAPGAARSVASSSSRIRASAPSGSDVTAPSTSLPSARSPAASTARSAWVSGPSRTLAHSKPQSTGAPRASIRTVSGPTLPWTTPAAASASTHSAIGARSVTATPSATPPSSAAESGCASSSTTSSGAAPAGPRASSSRTTCSPRARHSAVAMRSASMPTASRPPATAKAAGRPAWGRCGTPRGCGGAARSGVPRPA